MNEEREESKWNKIKGRKLSELQYKMTCKKHKYSNDDTQYTFIVLEKLLSKITYNIVTSVFKFKMKSIL